MNLIKIFRTHKNNFKINVKYLTTSYVQGQSPEPKIREYFYFIDHQGQLFLDDSRIKNFTSCFKDKKFLAFFFNRLRINDSSRYAEAFPYISLCGRERNFIRCEDMPIVYTNVLKTAEHEEEKLAYCNAGDLLTVVFEPEKICMNPANGRVYYPARKTYGGYGLVKSSLAFEWSPYFGYKDNNKQDEPPITFLWNNKQYKLTNELFNILDKNRPKLE